MGAAEEVHQSDEHDGEHRRWAQLVALLPSLLAGVSVLCALVAVFLHRANTSHEGVKSVLWLSDLVVAVTYPVVGAFLLRRRPGNPAGWLMTGMSLLGVYLLAGHYAVRALVVNGDRGAWPQVVAWFSLWGWAPHLFLPTLLPLLFPNGVAGDRRSRRLVKATVVLAAVSVAARMFAKTSADVSPQVDNPLGIAVAFNIPAFLAPAGLFLVVSPMAVATLVRRHREAQGRERAQLAWLMVGGIATVVGVTAQAPIPEPWGDIVFAVALAMVPLTIALAVVRHRLFDIEVVLNRALVYGALSGLVLLAYGATVVLVGRLAFGQGLALAVVALAALAAASARDRVQGWVDRLLYGARRDPYTVVARLGGRLDLAAGPLEALAALVEELRAALKLPYAAIFPADPDLPPVKAGSPVAGAESFPVTNQGIEVAQLEIGHRHVGERFRTEEQSLLADVARRGGALVHSAALVSDLQRSRERLVTAQKEERRRLRHDLHDGLGPQLAGIALQLDSLSDRVAANAELADSVERLRARLRQTVAEVRRIVDDLRPAALDELGLVGALREHVTAFASSDTSVAVVASETLPELPAAVEVAAYRIATEAVSNVVRHSGCRSCTVQVAVDDGSLIVSVTDDGCGISPSRRPGVGFQSMRDRTAELGGTFDVTVPDGGSGTVVRARLPVDAR